ncbi:MAG: hypothetical protein PARBB_03113 [Parabacteroides distasonis]|uniref:6-bladed beta-propeller n=1 Tax=Parabacteroides sp. TaxID=1869337 RepID=UPI00257F540C|nr:6-bladed beta-propeller [Parabacteroides sp.]
MKKYILVFAIFLAACTTTGERREECIIIDMSSTFDHSPEEVALESWAKSVMFVPLETNDSILIKYIDRIIKHDDKLLVQHGNRASVFDTKGKFLYDIGKQGGGPSEFSKISGLEPYNDSIYIKDSPRRIKVYDWKGNYHRSFHIPNKNIRNFCLLPQSNILLGYTPNLSGNVSTRLYFCQDTIVLDSVPYYKSYKKPDFVMTFTYEFRAFDKQNTVAFKELFCDTIFKVSNDLELIPYAVLDLGKYRTPEDLRYNITMDDIEKNLFQTKIMPVVSGEVNDRIYMYNFSNKDTYTLCYDKKSEQLAYANLVYSENLFEFPDEAAFTPQYISDDKRYLIDWEQPENDNNPVIVFVEP